MSLYISLSNSSTKKPVSLKLYTTYILQCNSTSNVWKVNKCVRMSPTIGKWGVGRPTFGPASDVRVRHMALVNLRPLGNIRKKPEKFGLEYYCWWWFRLSPSDIQKLSSTITLNRDGYWCLWSCRNGVQGRQNSLERRKTLAVTGETLR